LLLALAPRRRRRVLFAWGLAGAAATAALPLHLGVVTWHVYGIALLAGGIALSAGLYLFGLWRART
jgi:hypothetical protein